VEQLPPGALLELPVRMQTLEFGFKYQYLTLVHRHPVVNGHSGYLPPFMMFLGAEWSPLDEVAHVADSIRMLRSVGVRYVAVHPRDFEDTKLARAWLGTLRSERDQVMTGMDFDGMRVFPLAPGDSPPLPPAGLRRVPPTSIRASASHSPDRLPLLFDGDLDTRWLTGTPQSGNERLELAFDRPRDLAL